MVTSGHMEKNGCPEVTLPQKLNIIGKHINLEFGIGTYEQENHKLELAAFGIKELFI